MRRHLCPTGTCGRKCAASNRKSFTNSTTSDGIAAPSIMKEFGFSTTSMGLLLSAFFWTYALMQIPVGWAADRVNLRWLYFSAFVLWSLGQGLTGFATTLGVLILFRLLLGQTLDFYCGRLEQLDRAVLLYCGSRGAASSRLPPITAFSRR